MGEPDLMEALVINANSLGEDFNDGDSFPGWLTAEWEEDGDILEITYENPANEKTTQRYKIERVRD